MYVCADIATCRPVTEAFRRYLPWRTCQDFLSETWASTERTSNLFPIVWDTTDSMCVPILVRYPDVASHSELECSYKPDVEAFQSRWAALGDVADQKALIEEYTQRVTQIDIVSEVNQWWSAPFSIPRRTLSRLPKNLTCGRMLRRSRGQRT